MLLWLGFLVLCAYVYVFVRVDGGLLVLDPAAAALFGGVRQRKRARVTSVAPSVFAAAAAAAAAAEVGLAKKRKLREAPSLDALPDACLFEVLRRVQGARARGASACVSRRWLALLGGIRASEIKRAVPDLNQAFVADDEEDDEPASARPGRSERSLEGERATDVALTAAAVADALRGHLEGLVVRGSHPRSEERRVGKECTSWCRSRWSPYH